MVSRSWRSAATLSAGTSRVTASVGMGQAGIINIERESHLSGSIHDKGVLILAGYLRNRFGQNQPLALSASLCFERSYGGVEGDSASSTELYALLSRLANIPLRQDIAVTGSVNQWGEVQAIGGVNEKVEGFFDVCRTVKRVSAWPQRICDDRTLRLGRAKAIGDSSPSDIAR
jgi:predicted ATP-dependent protease